MATSSSTLHVLPSSVHARPACLQKPASAHIMSFRILSSGSLVSQDSATRFSDYIQRIRFNGARHAHWRRNDFKHNILHAKLFGRGFWSGENCRYFGSAFKRQRNCTEVSSFQCGGQMEKWKMSRSRAATIEDETGIFSTAAKLGSTAFKTVTVQLCGALLLGTVLLGATSADATDALKTCACLLKECRVELARCIADPACAANIACLQTCNNRPDETQCQIGCGDLFENEVVDQFNDCAVSRKGCVPQKTDEGDFPVPSSSAIVKEFNPNKFTGKWYITSGFNKTFDTFDCQLHEFSATPPNKITGRLSWRIPTPDGGFFTRTGVQNFVQDENQPGVLYNHDNVNLHYKDDWYILGSKIEETPDDYVFVYYRGSNDAWDGYGGAVVYTRSNTLPPSIIPELTSAAKRVGLDFGKFSTTNNTCGPEPPLFARLEKKAEEEEQYIAEEVVEEEMYLVQQVKLVVGTIGKFLGDIVKGEIDLFNNGANELKKDEELFLKGLGEEEKALLDKLNMKAKDIEDVFGRAIPIRKSR